MSKSTSSPDFDAIRAANPDLALSIYALTPGGSVTLEIITPDGEIFTFAGPTQADALAAAFPPDPPAPAVDIFD